ncbi:MAG: acetyl-CoA C-acyltransferase [Actinobacteria bacterium]|nr:acetyl-CoA C-acyltransferase [Actinomycetota bacterium]
MEEVFIYDAVRTPTGAYGGGLAGIRPDDLAAGVIRSLLMRTPGFDPAQISEVILGNANGAGEENRNVARMASLLAGIPTSVPGSTVNRLCASGLEAVVMASRSIAVGDSTIIVAGGVESMTRAPWVIGKPDKAFPRTAETMHSSTLGWRFINPLMREEWTTSLGGGAEILANMYAISRESQDEFAYQSHMKALKAWENGDFSAEVVSVQNSVLERDESIRPNTSLEALAKLKPAFANAGTVTGGNSSPLNDGASAILLGNSDAGRHLGAEPIARIVSRGTSGVEPQLYGLGPVEASKMALQRAGISWNDVKLVELNEAFAVQSLACMNEWPDLDPSKVNVSGGALALGHALGSSGSRILTTLVHGLKRAGGGYGVATLCIGVGQGIAVVVEV